jgi:hypothetical protein
MIGSVGVVLQQTTQQANSDATVGIAVATVVVGGVLVVVAGNAVISMIHKWWRNRK